MERNQDNELERSANLVETSAVKKVEPVVMNYAPVVPRKQSHISTKAKIIIGSALAVSIGLAYAVHWYIEGIRAAVSICGASGR